MKYLEFIDLLKVSYIFSSLITRKSCYSFAEFLSFYFDEGDMITEQVLEERFAEHEKMQKELRIIKLVLGLNKTLMQF